MQGKVFAFLKIFSSVFIAHFRPTGSNYQSQPSMQDSDEENFNDQEIDLVEESTDKTTKRPASFTPTTAAPSKKPKVSGSGMTAKVTIIAIYKIILGMSLWEV